MGIIDRIRSVILSKTIDSKHRTIGVEEECIIYDKKNLLINSLLDNIFYLAVLFK